MNECFIGYNLMGKSNLLQAASACPECDATFTSPHDFSLHMQSVHRLGGGGSGSGSGSGERSIATKTLGFGDLNYLDISSHKFREVSDRMTEN